MSFPVQAVGGNLCMLPRDAHRVEETWSSHDRSRGVPSIEPWYGMLRIPQPRHPRVLRPFVHGIDRSEGRYDMPCRNDRQTGIARE